MQEPPTWIEDDGFNPYLNELPQPRPTKHHMSFDDAIESLEATKTSVAMESKDGLELYALQQQVLIGDYYSFDENTIEKFATLLEQEQNKAWKKKRG